MSIRHLIFAAVIGTISATLKAEVFLGSNVDHWPQSASQKSKDGFGASLIITSDLNWWQKWDTPPETIPTFSPVTRLAVGEQAVILTLFANPMVDEGDNAQVFCDFKSTRPDGSIAFDYRDVPCLVGKLPGPRGHVHLSPGIMQFVGEENDPTGTWIFDVKVRDMNRQVDLQLRSEFELGIAK